MKILAYSLKKQKSKSYVTKLKGDTLKILCVNLIKTVTQDEISHKLGN